jgi:Tol biopolymer transport system component
VCSDGQSNDLCAIDRSGSGFTRLTSDGSAGVDRPAWRPDGTSIAFTRFPPGTTRPAIFLLDLATGALTRVTSGTGPAWSPDGSRLVFRGIDIVGLFTVDADGSSVTPLTKGAHSEPTWRP